MQLCIDTSDRLHTTIQIKHHEEIFTKGEQVEKYSSHRIIQLIQELLQEQNKKLSDITEIVVTEGPGSYTGLRVGATIGTVMSLLLQIPINGKTPGSVPVLKYGEDTWSIHSESI